MALTSEIRAIVKGTQTGSNDFGGSFAPNIDKILQFADGTAANQANILWADERTLAASATEELDLAGVLTDAFGTTVAAASVVAIMVTAASANTNNVIVTNGTAPFLLFGGTTPTFSVKPNGVMLLAAPGAGGLGTVTAVSADQIKLTNSGAGTGVTYQIVILARTA